MATIAAATESSPSNHSSRGPNLSGGDGGGGQVSSPSKLRRSALHSPWVQVVRRGGCGDSSSTSAEQPAAVTRLPLHPPSPSPSAVSSTPEPAPPGSSASKHPPPPPPPAPAEQQASTPPESSVALDCSDKSGGSNVGSSSKKPAWSKPSDGAYEAPGPVMGASSWPALSECTRPAPKSSSDNSRFAIDGSGLVVVTQLQAPNLQPKQSNANTKSNSATSNPPPGRQRSLRRGGVGGSRYGGHARAPSSWPLFPTAQTVNDHLMQRSSSQRGNFGQHGYRDGPHHNNHGVQRDHNRGPNGWNNAPDWNARGFYGGQPRRGGGRGFTRPTGPVFPSFMGPPPVRPYGNVFGYPDTAAPMYYVCTLGSDHFGAISYPPSGPPPPPGPVTYPVIMPDPKSLSIVNQIDYYFSDENLVKDEFLRSNMDAEGWVPVTLIASFPRIQSKNADIPSILKALALSNVVEVQDYRIRRRDGWMRWIPCNRFPTILAGSYFGGPTHDELAASLENASLDGAANTTNDQVSYVETSNSHSGETPDLCTDKEWTGRREPATNMEGGADKSPAR